MMKLILISLIHKQCWKDSLSGLPDASSYTAAISMTAAAAREEGVIYLETEQVQLLNQDGTSLDRSKDWVR
jgi:hypothetical protein